MGESNAGGVKDESFRWETRCKHQTHPLENPTLVEIQPW